MSVPSNPGGGIGVGTEGIIGTGIGFGGALSFSFWTGVFLFAA
ncbi:MAG: hypothetical protein ACTHME_08300 [Candidatus Nitrosocosmicus sp.]